MKKKTCFAALTIAVTMIIAACGKTESNSKVEEAISVEAEDVSEKTVSEQETVENDNSLSSAAGKSKEEYIEEMGVTEENSKIVMYYQYGNYVQYKVYEFEDTEYQLTIYDFYDNEESFLVPYNYAKKYDLDEYFDSTCYLHSYQEPITKGKREDAYAGVMYSIENQMKYSNNDIFLVEKD